MTAGPRGTEPLFVERQTYRLRRLRDAGRALPLLALVLWLMPMLWGLPGAETSASTALIYLFGTWAVFGVGAWLLILAQGIAERRQTAEEAAREDAARRDAESGFFQIGGVDRRSEPKGADREGSAANGAVGEDVEGQGAGADSARPPDPMDHRAERPG